MRITVSRLVFVAVSGALLALFVRLGFWQLDRLEQRRGENVRHRATLERPTLRMDRAPDAPADSLHWRRVAVQGRFDYEREIVLAPRSLEGTPAVYLLTPLIVDGPGDGDSTALPVLRGAVPAPDGFHAPVGKARPPPAGIRGGGAPPADARADATVTVHGLSLPPPEVETASRPDTLHTGVGVLTVLPRLDLPRIRERLPYRTLELYVQEDSSTAEIPPADGVQLPMRVAPPRLDDGPHLMYAIQWFSFAAILLVGGTIYLVRG